MPVIDPAHSFQASPPVFFHDHAQRTTRAYKNPGMCSQPAVLRKSLPPPGRSEGRTCARQGAVVPIPSAAAIPERLNDLQGPGRATRASTLPASMPSEPEANAATRPLPLTRTVRRNPVHTGRARAQTARPSELLQRVLQNQAPHPASALNKASGSPEPLLAAAVSARRPSTSDAVIEGEVVGLGKTGPPLCRAPSASVHVALPAAAPVDPQDNTSAALTALAAAGPPLVRARSVGVDIANSPAIRRLVQIARVPLAFVDLITATALALVSASTCREAAVMAAYQLKEAIDALRKPLAQEPSKVPVAGPMSRDARAGMKIGADTPALVAITRARESLQLAKRQANVDMARSAFLNRLLGVGVACLALGLSIAATVATGGLAGVALLLSALLLRQAIANAHCAWTNKQAVDNGRAPLPMGTSALGNAMYAHFRRQGMTAEQAKWEASKVSAICSTIVAGAGLALGATITTVLPLAAKCVRVVCSFVAAVVLPSVDHLRSGGDQLRLKEHQRLLERMVAQPYLERWMREKDEARQRLVAQLAPDMPAPETAAEEAQALAAELRLWDLRAPSMIKAAEKLAAGYGVEPLRTDAQAQSLRTKGESLSAFNWAVPTWVSVSGSLLNALI